MVGIGRPVSSSIGRLLAYPCSASSTKAAGTIWSGVSRSGRASIASTKSDSQSLLCSRATSALLWKWR